MSDTLPYSGADTAEPRRYALSREKIAISAGVNKPRTSRPNCTLNLPSARGRLSVTQSRRWSSENRRTNIGPRSVQVERVQLGDGWTHLIQCG